MNDRYTTEPFRPDAEAFRPNGRRPRPPRPQADERAKARADQIADNVVALFMRESANAQDFCDAVATRAAQPKQEDAGAEFDRLASATKRLAEERRQSSESWDRAPPPEEHEQKQERIPPRIIRPTIFFGRTPPKRRWIVPDWIPYGAVTGLYGQGGLGKSLLVMLLQTSGALGSPWLSLPVDEIISLGVYCEDDEDELWRRQWAINADYGCDLDQRLDGVHWMPRLGEDNLLMTFTRNGVGELTKFHREVGDAALDVKAKLVIVDANSDTFGGNENDRSQVRQYVQIALYRIAHRIGGAVLCNAHPSRAGVSSGSGESGSTAWEAAFRSRLYFHEPDQPPDQPRDYDARVLERMKANYAARGAQLTLRYRKGVFIPDSANMPGVTSAGVTIDAAQAFLGLVQQFTDQKRTVSSNVYARNYAPRVFARLPRDHRSGFGQGDFERALEKLLKDKTVENIVYGRPSDERTKIVVRDLQDTEPTPSEN
jgi:RecA-family ATPase